ncbi:hypothetical protein AKJ65_02815 [candidate division MSBL1 archaeon SCGC-AAA259E19]|uniref:Uncharacterized protein n=1 Tax=candidate division MSBL1 archaeon SCGC-AAA259E19 TaxID=1698264 RepID=A0A133ULC1_9EURY|nr:hypothetical protein AKJ65_02815 [candidate division MSBL1 archaeon SCGC-AAA259E19]
MSEENLGFEDMDHRRYYDWLGEDEWNRRKKSFLNSLELKKYLVLSEQIPARRRKNFRCQRWSRAIRNLAVRNRTRESKRERSWNILKRRRN